MNKNEQAFFALVRAGLWEEDVQLLPYGDVDWDEVYRLAQEQSVLGLVAAGLEHVTDVKAPKMVSLQFVGDALVLEERNKAMNDFIANLVDKMGTAGIYTLLVKGQGVAQCYERPLWRACGDVDLFLSDENYDKAKCFLVPLASNVEYEGKYSKHLGMTIDSWVVELHGSMRCGLSNSIDKGLDEIRDDIFYGGNVRSWMNRNTQVFLPSINNDVVYVFTHFLNHFYKGGIGIRQICDWCRLLWTYKDSLNHGLLEARIKQIGLMSEWSAFGAFAVDYLGMPMEAMPFINDNANLNANKKKAERICEFIMEVGNFGHNRDYSYFDKYPFVVRKMYSLGRRFGDIIRHARLFPRASLRFFPKMFINGLRAAIRGEG